MRILLVTGSFPPMRCGVGDYCLQLANALAVDASVQVGVVTSTLATGAEVNDGVEVFPVINRWTILEAQRIVKVIKSWAPDVVHIQYPSQGYREGFLPWVLPLIAFIMGKKIVQTWHEGYSRRDAPRLILKAIVPSCLVFVRPRYVESLHPQLRWVLWRKKTEFIPNASAIPRADLDLDQLSEIKQLYAKGQKRLVAFFGFVYPHKGVDLLFEIADPASDHIVIAGPIDASSIYGKEILRKASAEAWRGKVTIAGFLLPKDAASLLACADAVVLPFRTGGGEWNTSIHGAVLNGTFVITTSLVENGFSKKRNVYYANVDHVLEMKAALEKYGGRKRDRDFSFDQGGWVEIANRHYLMYKKFLAGR